MMTDLPTRVINAISRLVSRNLPPMVPDVTSVEADVRDPSMRVNLICYEDYDAWILGKIACRLRDELSRQGVEVSLGKTPVTSADINHHIVYWNYLNPCPTIETVMVTHIDTESELNKVRRQLTEDGVQMGICMSFEAVHRLAHFGLPRERLCFVNPAHDGVLRPRKLLVGLTTRIYPDGCKREYLLEQLASHISPDDFRFSIMGSGWHSIVERLRAADFDVDYIEHFDRDLYLQIMPSLDYYLYLGMDEGSMGFLDALAAGVATIVTPQGFHLDLKDGMTYVFEDINDLRRVFTDIATARRRRVDSVRPFTWSAYARKHLLIWEYLLTKRDHREIPKALMVQLESLGVLTSAHAGIVRCPRESGGVAPLTRLK